MTERQVVKGWSFLLVADEEDGCRLPLISPSSRFRIIWIEAVTCALVYTLIFVPYRLRFLPRGGRQSGARTGERCSDRQSQNRRAVLDPATTRLQRLAADGRHDRASLPDAWLLLISRPSPHCKQTSPTAGGSSLCWTRAAMSSSSPTLSSTSAWPSGSRTRSSSTRAPSSAATRARCSCLSTPAPSPSSCRVRCSATPSRGSARR